MPTLIKTVPLLLLMLTAGCSVEEKKEAPDEPKKEHIMRSQINALEQAKEAKNLMNEATKKSSEEAEKLTSKP